VTITDSGVCTGNPVLYLVPCPELVEGADFVKDFCLAVIGKLALSAAEGTPHCLSSISLADVNWCRNFYAELYFLL